MRTLASTRTAAPSHGDLCNLAGTTIQRLVAGRTDVRTARIAIVQYELSGEALAAGKVWSILQTAVEFSPCRSHIGRVVFWYANKERFQGINLIMFPMTFEINWRNSIGEPREPSTEPEFPHPQHSSPGMPQPGDAPGGPPPLRDPPPLQIVRKPASPDKPQAVLGPLLKYIERSRRCRS